MDSAKVHATAHNVGALYLIFDTLAVLSCRRLVYVMRSHVSIVVVR